MQYSMNLYFVICSQPPVLLEGQANSEEEGGASRLTSRWLRIAVYGQRGSSRAVAITEAPSSRVVFVQGIRKDTKREPSRRVLKDMLERSISNRGMEVKRGHTP